MTFITNGFTFIKKTKKIFLMFLMLIISGQPSFAIYQGSSTVGKTIYKVVNVYLEQNEEDETYSLVFGSVYVKRSVAGHFLLKLDFPIEVYNKIKTGNKYNLVSTGDDSEDIKSINLTFTESILTKGDIKIITETNVDSNAKGLLRILSYNPRTRKLKVELLAKVSNYLKNDKNVSQPVTISLKSVVKLPKPIVYE